MKHVLTVFSLIVLASCASVDSINKSPNCTVWRDQKYWGPYSIEVVEHQVYWDSLCKNYHSQCSPVAVKLDENNNVLYGSMALGKIENNELRFSEKHTLTEIVNFAAVRAYPEQKIIKSSILENGVMREDTLKYNDKCSAEEAVVGGVALGVIGKLQSKN